MDDLTIQFQYLEDSIFNFEVLSVFPIMESTETYRNKYNNCVEGLINDCVFDFSGDDVFTGAGPYMIDSHDTKNHEFQFVKNPYYHDKEVWADRLIFQGNLRDKFDAGSNVSEVAKDQVADLISVAFNPALLEEWEKPHPYVLFNWPHAQVFQIRLNFLHPIFGTGETIPYGPLAESDNNVIQALHVRKAFSHLIDRDYMNDPLMWGGAAIPTSSLIPPTAVGYNASQEVDEFSIELAKSHLEKAGFDYNNIIDSNGDGDYNDENDTQFFEFINFADSSDEVEFIGYTASQFAKVGIVLQVLPFNLSRTFRYKEEGVKVPTYEEGGFDSLITTWVYPQPFSTNHHYTSR